MMSETAVRRAVKELIEANKDTWLDGIVHQGRPKEIALIAITQFTPPIGGIHMCVYSTGFSLDVDTSSQGVITGKTYIFPIRVDIADFIISQVSDTAQYETMNQDFLLFRDRMVETIYTYARNRTIFADSETGTNFTVKIPESEYGTLVDVSETEEFDMEGFPVAFSTVSFDISSC